jgi:hypothetical protein
MVENAFVRLSANGNALDKSQRQALVGSVAKTA